MAERLQQRDIRGMFSAIAPRYDFLNRLTSLGLDQGWRRAAVEAAELRGALRVLDLGCGTGDLAFHLLGAVPDLAVVGTDFAGPMLALARERAAREAPGRNLSFVQADACALPFPDAAFDRLTMAFVLRNIPDWRRALREMARVVRPGGRAVVLEFAWPEGRLFRTAYRMYFFTVVPLLGWLFTRTDAYAYLPRSVENFPPPEEILAVFREAGFNGAGNGMSQRRLAQGAVRLYVAERA